MALQVTTLPLGSESVTTLSSWRMWTVWYVLYDLVGTKVAQNELLRYSGCRASCRHRRGAAVQAARKAGREAQGEGGTLVVEAPATGSGRTPSKHHGSTQEKEKVSKKSELITVAKIL